MKAALLKSLRAAGVTFPRTLGNGFNIEVNGMRSGWYATRREAIQIAKQTLKPVQPKPAAAIPCRAGFYRTADSAQPIAVWIESPRTGKRIELAGGFVNQLPPRFVSRLIHAKANGRKVVEYSPVELKAFYSVYTQLMERCKPLPGPGKRRAPSAFGIKRRKWGRP